VQAYPRSGSSALFEKRSPTEGGKAPYDHRTTRSSGKVCGIERLFRERYNTHWLLRRQRICTKVFKLNFVFLKFLWYRSSEKSSREAFFVHTWVSVIVSAWNAERTIEQAIRSALEQTLEDLEVIVIDAGSKDGTADVVRKIAAEDGRVRLLRNEVNRGPAAARNLGLCEARGDWIAILDADDFFLREDRLERLVEIGEEYSADIVADDMYIFKDGDTRYVSRFKEISGININYPQEINLSFFIDQDLGSLKPIFRTKFFKEKSKEYKENLIIREDFVLIVELMLNGAKFLLYPEAGYAYREHQNSIQVKVYDEKEEINKESIEYIKNMLINTKIDRKSRESLIKYIILGEYYRFVSMIKRKRILKSIKIIKENPKIMIFVLRRIFKKTRLK